MMNQKQVARFIFATDADFQAATLHEKEIAFVQETNEWWTMEGGILRQILMGGGGITFWSVVGDIVDNDNVDGDVGYCSATGRFYIFDGTNWQQMTGAVGEISASAMGVSSGDALDLRESVRFELYQYDGGTFTVGTVTNIIGQFDASPVLTLLNDAGETTDFVFGSQFFKADGVTPLGTITLDTQDGLSLRFGVELRDGDPIMRLIDPYLSSAGESLKFYTTIAAAGADIASIADAEIVYIRDQGAFYQNQGGTLIYYTTPNGEVSHVGQAITGDGSMDLDVSMACQYIYDPNTPDLLTIGFPNNSATHLWEVFKIVLQPNAADFTEFAFSPGFFMPDGVTPMQSLSGSADQLQAISFRVETDYDGNFIARLLDPIFTGTEMPVINYPSEVAAAFSSAKLGKLALLTRMGALIQNYGGGSYAHVTQPYGPLSSQGDLLEIGDSTPDLGEGNRFSAPILTGGTMAIANPTNPNSGTGVITFGLLCNNGYTSTWTWDTEYFMPDGVTPMPDITFTDGRELSLNFYKEFRGGGGRAYRLLDPYFALSGSTESLALCRARATTVQAITNATTTVVALDTAVIDSDGLFVNASDRIVISTAGRYRIRGRVAYGNSSNTGPQSAKIRLNGTTIIAGGAARNNDTFTIAEADVVMDLAAGNYLELIAYQSNGSSLNTYVGSTPIGDGAWSELEVVQIATVAVQNTSTEVTIIKGTVLMGDVGTGTGTGSVTATGGITGVKSQNGSFSVITVTHAALINPIPVMTLVSLGTADLDNDLETPYIRNVTSTGFEIWLKESGSNAQNLRINVIVAGD